MKTSTHFFVFKSIVILPFVIIFIVTSCSDNTQVPKTYENVWLNPTEQVKGTLETINDIEVMKLWGTHYEQGYACGYLKAPEILSIINGVIQTEFKGITKSFWEIDCMSNLQNLNIEERFMLEFQGIYDGMNARAEKDVYVPILERKLKLEDILIMNSFHEVLAFNCSSFAAWGNMTENGNAIIVKNNDWFITSFPLVDMLIMCVRKQSSESGVISTITVTVPGIISMGAGINSGGIVAYYLDAQGNEPTQASSFTPILQLSWDALENTHNETVIINYENILKSHNIFLSGAAVVGFPQEENEFEACIFECDGDKSVGDGVTIRYPDISESYIICTNHFRERIAPVNCWRYDSLEQELDKISNSNGTEYLTVNKAWDMLSEVPIEGDLIYYSIVYEPEKGLMHLAVSRNQVHAPDCEKTTFNIDSLFNN